MKAKPSASSPAVSHSSKSGKVLGRLIPLLLIFGALIAPGVVRSLTGDREGQNSSGGAGVDWGETAAKLRQSLEQAKSEAERAEEALLTEFAKQMEEAQNTNRRETDEALDATVGILVQPRELAWLIADYAQDKVRGGDRATKRIEACSGQFSEALKDSTLRVHELIDKLQQDLAAVNNRYAISVGEGINQQAVSIPPSKLEQFKQLREAVPFDVTLEVGATGTAAALELVTVQTTKSSIVKISSFLAQKLAPQIAKGAVGVGAAVADGPLLFGDILTVGLAIWTAYDVATLPGAIREDVRNEYRHAADEHHRLLEVQTNESLKEIAERSHYCRDEMHRKMLAEL